MRTTLPKDTRQHLAAIVKFASREPWENVPLLVQELLEPLALPERLRSAMIESLRAARVAEAIEQALAGSPLLLSAEDVIDEARLRGQAEALVLKEPMFSAAEAGRILGSTSSTKPSHYAHSLRRDGSLVGLPQRNTFVFPQFQFDVARGHVFTVVADVNRLLGAADDPWGVASWWLTTNLRAGASPRQLLAGGKYDELRSLAAAEAEPVDP
ncbi:MAG TPA: hypothetical protein VMK12_32725 [Anaeromyxobacteraceae bacterium]|nr:hypothetical protein [Anaeromyxobacteraceae bacterium]